jgi:hypothetical protein
MTILVVGLSSLAAGVGAGSPRLSHVVPANIIDGTDERDSILRIGPSLGLSPAEIARIRKVSGYVGCLSPSPSVGAGALFLTNDQVLTAAHIFFEPSGRKRWKCFFRAQEPDAPRIDLLIEGGAARFGATKPKPGSNDDFAVVRLAEPIPDAVPFPVDLETPIAAGDRLIVITAHPAGMERDVPLDVPVAQPCTVRRVPISSGATSFYRTDCDASGSSSGGMHLSRVKGRLVFRGITISTGAWRDPKLRGAPYDESRKSATTALGTDAAVLKAGRDLASDGR